MRGLLSLDQELRAVRNSSGQKNAKRPTHSPEPGGTERPWKQDIDLVHQTMREVIRVIASLSGVELPGLPPGLQDDEAPPPRLEIKTLKDRFRNELEGFSIKTTEELAKRAKEQTQAALDAVQNEVIATRIDQVAAELREKLQAPAQIEKFVEPAVQGAAAKLEVSFSQKVEHLFAEQQRLIQDKLQEALGSVHAQVSGQVDAEFRDILQLPAHIESLVGPCVGESAARLESSLSQKVEHLFAEQQQLVQDRLQGALSSVQAQISTLEQAVQQIRERKADPLAQVSVEQANSTLESSLSQKVEHLFAEQQQLVQDKLQGALSSVQAQISTLEQAVQQIRERKADPVAQVSVEQANATLERSLSQKIEQLFAGLQQSVQDRVQGALSSVQAQIGTLEQSVQQIRVRKGDSVLPVSPEPPNAAADYGTIKDASRLSNANDKGLDQAFSRVELSFHKLMESFKTQPAQNALAALEGQRKVLRFNDAEIDSRVQQALDNLDRLGSKSPQRAS